MRIRSIVFMVTLGAACGQQLGASAGAPTTGVTAAEATFAVH